MNVPVADLLYQDVEPDAAEQMEEVKVEQVVLPVVPPPVLAATPPPTPTPVPVPVPVPEPVKPAANSHRASFHQGHLHEFAPRIVVVGVGGAGGNAVNNMIANQLQGKEGPTCLDCHVIVMLLLTL